MFAAYANARMPLALIAAHCTESFSSCQCHLLCIKVWTQHAGFRVNTTQQCVAGSGCFDARTFAVTLSFAPALPQADVAVTVVLRHQAPTSHVCPGASSGLEWRNFTLLSAHPINAVDGGALEVTLSGAVTTAYTRPAQTGVMQPYGGSVAALDSAFGGADVSGVWIFDVYTSGADAFSGQFKATLDFKYEVQQLAEIEDAARCMCPGELPSSTYTTMFTPQSYCTPLPISDESKLVACLNGTSILGYNYKEVTCAESATGARADLAQCFKYDCNLSYFDRARLRGVMGYQALLPSACQFRPDCKTKYECAVPPHACDSNAAQCCVPHGWMCT